MAERKKNRLRDERRQMRVRDSRRAERERGGGGGEPPNGNRMAAGVTVTTSNVVNDIVRTTRASGSHRTL